MNKYYFQLIDPNYDTPKILLLKNVINEDADIYFEFQDGIRCNVEYILPLGVRHNIINAYDYIMVQLESPDKSWTKETIIEGEIQEKWANEIDNDPTSERFCIQPYVPGKKTFKFKAPTNINYYGNEYKNFDKLIEDFLNKSNMVEEDIIDTSSILKHDIVEVPKTNNKPVDINNIDIDPVDILATKSKKVSLDIDVTLNMSIPPKTLYKMVEESFDDGGNKLIEYILKNIDYNSINESIKEGLLSVYENE